MPGGGLAVLRKQFVRVGAVPGPRVGQDARQVFRPPVSVGIATGRRAPAEDERHPSGTAVSASAALCSVSPSSATDPDSAATAAWITAVAPRTAREIHSARIPSALASIAASTLSAASCEWGRTRCTSRASTPFPWL